MKKILFLAIFMGILPISCFCPDSDLDYMELTGFELKLLINEVEQLGDMNVKQSDVVRFSIYPNEYKHVASLDPLIGCFANSAFATSCDNEGNLGFKPSIDSLEIISNNDFLEIPSGNNLNQHFEGIFDQRNDDGSERIRGEVNLLTNFFNDVTFEIDEGYLGLLNKPQNQEEHTFTITIYLADGTSIHEQSAKINFLSQ